VQIGVFAIGRMKSGPGRELAALYFERFARSAPQIGLGFAGVTEKPESRLADAPARKQEEAGFLCAHLDASPGAHLFLLDEAGAAMTSARFAADIGRLRDDGSRSLVFAIGGADGHASELAGRANRVIAFGPATWPHQIVRIMLAEQLYRAATILSGHPYHRA
jgi:23S rRNA (pseudouridine1915-N3)-methyltransferase